MSRTANERTIMVEERHGTHWIRVGSPTLGTATAAEIRIACLRGLDRGVPNIVVDLSNITEISSEGTDTLAAAADEMLAKGGALWLVDDRNASPEPRPVPSTGLGGLVGLNAALDAALARESTDPAAGGASQPNSDSQLK